MSTGDEAGRRGGWAGGTGAALTAAGLVGTHVAFTLPVLPARTELPEYLVLRVVMLDVVTIVAVVVWWLVEPRRARSVTPASPTSPSWPRRALALVALFLAATAAWSAWRATQHDLDGGLWRAAMPMATGALAVALVGIVLFLAAPTRAAGTGVARPTRRTVRVAAAQVAVGVVAVVAVVVVARAVEDRAVDATVASAPADGASPAADGAGPGAPTGVAWTQGAEDRRFHSVVVPAGDGVAAVADDDGGEAVVGLDLGSGDERWRHRRPRADVTGLGASPGGRWVVATFTPDRNVAGGRQLVALDGATGEVGADVALDPLGEDTGMTGGFGVDGVFGTTDRTIAVAWAADGQPGVQGIDPATGAQVWAWSAPAGCSLGRWTPMAGPDAIVVPLACESSPGFRVLGLDDGSGGVRWEWGLPLGAAESRVLDDRAVDGTALSLHVTSPEPLPGEPGPAPQVDEGNVVLDAASGAVLRQADDYRPEALTAEWIVFTGDEFVVDDAGETRTEYLVERPLGAEPVSVLRPSCAGAAGPPVVVGGALVTTCPVDGEVAVHVAPLDDPAAATTFAADLVRGTVDGDPDALTPYVEVLPGGIALAQSGGGAIALLAHDGA